jgi:hypothetical protein
MLLSRFSLLLLLFIVLAGSGLALWRYLPIAPSTAAVFSFPAAAERFDQAGEFAGAIAVYHADRGAECKLSAPDGSQITVFYFEWDQVKAGPMMGATGHTPEQCNVAAGFKLLEVAANRTYQADGQLPLVFDSTHFADSGGQDVFVFKMFWMQELGTRSLREGESRIERLKSSFIRHAGAARVLQGGVSGARDADHAWQVFQSDVLEKLEWK